MYYSEEHGRPGAGAKTIRSVTKKSGEYLHVEFREVYIFCVILSV